MRVCRIHFYAAHSFQPFCVSERNSGHACAMTAGIDADDEFPFFCIVVKLIVKLSHHLHRFGVVEKRIQHFEVWRQFSVVFEIPVEVNDFFPERFCFAHLVIKDSDAKLADKITSRYYLPLPGWG